MFQTGNAARQKQEAEQKIQEEAKIECRNELKEMSVADPKEAERIKKRLDELMKKYVKLPPDFRKQVLDKARAYECSANMRAANRTLDKALMMAQRRKVMERTQLLGEARKYYGKALMLGAEKEFQVAADRMIDSIMMTTAPDPTRPTRAKPLTTAPRNPHSAKC